MADRETWRVAVGKIFEVCGQLPEGTVAWQRGSLRVQHRKEARDLYVYCEVYM